MIGIIYKITNSKNGKAYIGKTYSSLDKRISEHLRDSRKNSCKSRPLYRAINKYGFDSFTVEIIEHCEESVLETRERFFIGYYNTFKKGYNATKGGDGRRYLDIEDSTILEHYKVIGSVSGVSRKLSIDYGTIKKILHSHGISTSDKYSGIANKVAIVDPYLEFNSASELARFLIECEITTASFDTVRSKVASAARKERETYLGLIINKI